MNPRRTAFATLAACIVAGGVRCAVAAEADDAWRGPVHIPPAAAQREIALAAGVDAAAWAASHGVAPDAMLRSADGGTLLSVRMDDARWSDGALCRDPAVAACSTSSCATVQSATADGADDLAEARLLREPDDLESVLAGDVEPPRFCASNDGPTSLPLGFDTATRSLDLSTSAADGAALQDSDCWTVAVADRCVTWRAPLSALLPAAEPDRVVVLLAPGATAASIAASHGLTVLKEIRLAALDRRLATLRIGLGQTVDAAVAELAGDASIESAQPDYVYRTSVESDPSNADTSRATSAATDAASPPTGDMPNDPYAFLAYGPVKIGAKRLYDRSTGKSAHVALIDTGVDLEHPELAGRIRAHEDFTGFGWSADPHGTAVAGIVAARMGNHEGSFGVAPDAELFLYKACEPKRPAALAARCWTSALLPALDAALATDARVVNLSLGGPPDPLLARYVALAHDKGRLVVAAAGNGGPLAKPTYPAALPDVVAVAAVDANDQSYVDDTVGAFVALSAPGVDIVAPLPARTYPVLSGTSMAAAHVSGAAALLMDLVPTASADDVRAALAATARDLGPPGTDPRFGAGEVDVCGALQRLSEGAIGCDR